MTVHGVLLAAGAGTRMGMPKALVHDEHGSWVLRAVATLTAGGCSGVTVVLGAAAEQARDLLGGAPVEVVVAEDWAEGMAASMRAGLRAVPASATAALVTLVDLPDLTSAVVRRVAAAGATPTPASTLARAAYDGVPGHPVLLGRDHLAGVIGSARGDRGARDYLAAHEVTLVECGDLASGRDVDSRCP